MGDFIHLGRIVIQDWDLEQDPNSDFGGVMRIRMQSKLIGFANTAVDNLF
jgi:hypothetical protein